MDDETVGYKSRFEGVYGPVLACSLRLTSEGSQSYELAAKQKKEEKEKEEKKKKKKRCRVPIKT